jgi:hypothetical protein
MLFLGFFKGFLKIESPLCFFFWKEGRKEGKSFLLGLLEGYFNFCHLVDILLYTCRRIAKPYKKKRETTQSP